MDKFVNHPLKLENS